MFEWQSKEPKKQAGLKKKKKSKINYITDLKETTSQEMEGGKMAVTYVKGVGKMAVTYVKGVL